MRQCVCGSILEYIDITQLSLSHEVVGNGLRNFLELFLCAGEVALLEQEFSEKRSGRYVTGISFESLCQHMDRHLHVPGLFILFGKRHEEL